MTLPKSASISAFAVAFTLGAKLSTFDAGLRAQCRFDTYLSRPHGLIVERGLAGVVAFREFSCDIEHVPLALFVMSSLRPCVPQFAITAAIGDESRVFLSQMESLIQEVPRTRHPLLH